MTHHTKPVILLILANQITSMGYHTKRAGFLFLILPNKISPMAQHTKVVFFFGLFKLPQYKKRVFLFYSFAQSNNPSDSSLSNLLFWAIKQPQCSTIQRDILDQSNKPNDSLCKIWYMYFFNLFINLNVTLYKIRQFVKMFPIKQPQCHTIL